MIGIVDYGMGNVGSIKNMLKKIGQEASVCNAPSRLASFDKIILPGVGAFDNAMEKLNAGGFSDKIVELATQAQKPVLGICLGMQLLSDGSEEGKLSGLGLIKGQVLKFNLSTDYKIPHMGWNTVKPQFDNPLLRNLESNKFYFVHSYYYKTADKECSVGLTQYEIEFASMVHKGNVFGAQFHPEKSHKYGMELFRNFAAL